MTQAIPEGQEGLIPHLVCDPCSEAIEFYKKAFGAEEIGRVEQPAISVGSDPRNRLTDKAKTSRNKEKQRLKLMFWHRKWRFNGKMIPCEWVFQA